MSYLAPLSEAIGTGDPAEAMVRLRAVKPPSILPLMLNRPKRDQT